MPSLWCALPGSRDERREKNHGHSVAKINVVGTGIIFRFLDWDNLTFFNLFLTIFIFWKVRGHRLFSAPLSQELVFMDYPHANTMWVLYLRSFKRSYAKQLCKVGNPSIEQMRKQGQSGSESLKIRCSSPHSLSPCCLQRKTFHRRTEWGPQEEKHE